jgi:hypothetical protein
MHLDSIACIDTLVYLVFARSVCRDDTLISKVSENRAILMLLNAEISDSQQELNTIELSIAS